MNFECREVDEMYMNRISRGVLSGFYEYMYRSGTVFSIIPSIGYTDMNTRYVYPRREMEIHRLHSQLMLKAMFPCGHWLLRGELGGRYVASLTPELQLPAVETAKPPSPASKGERFTLPPKERPL